MSFLTGPLAIVFVVSLFAGIPYVWYRCHRKLRAKGYGVYSISSMFLAMLIGCLIVAPAFGGDFATYLGPLLWIGVVLVLTRFLLARRRARRAGKRSAFWPSFWGRVVVVLGCTLTLFFTWQLIFPTIVPRGSGWQAWLVSAAMTITLSDYCFKISRRIKGAPERLSTTTASAFYLRAFDEEGRPFAFGPRSALRQYTNQWTAHAPMQGDPTLKLTLDDYFDEAVTAHFGSFVALGNPHDKLPPDGAVREYATDDEWQTRFFDLAQAATCIIVTAGGSANLEWELSQIKNRGLARKLCLFTSPIVPGTDRKLLNRLRRTATKRAATIAMDWKQAREMLGRAGFTLDGNPGPGIAVAFDEQGLSTLLTTDATTPAEFIIPVADWFKTGHKSGRCVPVSCSTCSAATYAPPLVVAEGAQCYNCRQNTRPETGALSGACPSIIAPRASTDARLKT